jgi:hypothetical protein
VQCHLCHREADLGVGGRARQSGGECNRIDIGANAVEMMLGQPDRVVAQTVGEQRFLERLVDDAGVVRRGAAFGEQEVGDFHPARLCDTAVHDTLASPLRKTRPHEL